MNLEEKLKKQQYKEIWQQYCGFLDLSMDGYMKIQRRLMEEQVKLWSNCGLGQSILKGKHPQNLDEFRKMVPLTTYDDYADILLAKQPDMLPGNPVIWIQTTWEVESTRSRWHRILEACWTPIGIMLQHV